MHRPAILCGGRFCRAVAIVATESRIVFLFTWQTYLCDTGEIAAFRELFEGENPCESIEFGGLARATT
jgi:hypothetical protein